MEKIATLTNKEQRAIKRMEEMMESCFTYGGIEEEGYNFVRYIAEYKKEMPTSLFWLVYNNKKQSLELNYEVVVNTSQDGEGNWYNTLKRK